MTPAPPGTRRCFVRLPLPALRPSAPAGCACETCVRCAGRSVIPDVVFRGRQDIGVDPVRHGCAFCRPLTGDARRGDSLFATDAWLGTRKVLGKAVDSFILVPALVAC